MEILLADDIPEKAEEIGIFLSEHNLNYYLATNEKGVKDILKQRQDFSILLLDMAMHRSSKDNTVNNFAGINVLNFMKVYQIEIPVVVITSYWDFVSLEAQENSTNVRVYFNYAYRSDTFENKCPDSNDISNIRYLDRLHQYMCQRYPNYVGAVQFSNVNSKWKLHLTELLTIRGGKKIEYTIT